jgi:hypothetical protein
MWLYLGAPPWKAQLSIRRAQGERKGVTFLLLKKPQRRKFLLSLISLLQKL